MRYFAVIRKAEDSDFSVEFPDFAGCITAGEDLDEAADMAAEALAFHIRGVLEDGEELPKPSTLKQIRKVMEDTEAAGDDGETIAILSVDIDDPSRVVRLNVSMDERLLKTIDEYATEHGQTRSAVLALAARKLVMKRR